MENQINTYEIDTLAILGVAGGNGLNHINSERQKKVYGIDINADYLYSCKSRYRYLADTLVLLNRNLTDLSIDLPKVDLVIANLFIEYIGLNTFTAQLKKMSPKYVSTITQVNNLDGFVSVSPYQRTFDCLDSIYHEISTDELSEIMKASGFELIFENEKLLPNGKKLKRQDFRI